MNIKKLLIVSCVMLALVSARAQEAIDVNTTVSVFGKKPVPISLSGFSGEALEVLKFDLYVQGFTFVEPDAAVFQLRGSNAGQVTGTFTDKTEPQKSFSRTYTGSTVRVQAHTLANDIVEAVNGQKGIGLSRIAYKSQNSDGNGEIFISDYDGHGPQAVTADNAIVAKPAWVPGRLALLYTSYKMGPANIFINNLATGSRRVFAGYPGLNTSAMVSPDGTKVAMVLGKEGRPRIFVADIDGKNLKRLTAGDEDSSPCWSPDGRTICFASKIKGRRRLAKVSVDGGPVQTLDTSGMASPSEPAWSPDGKWIAFTRLGGEFDICVMSADGKVPATVITAGENPSWSPNSRTLVFNRNVNRHQVLSVLDVFTKQYKDCARAAGSNSQPAWAK
jgi:TolB protein